MPIYGNVACIDSKVVDIPTMPYYAPLEWGGDRESRATLYVENGRWLSAHPIRPNDEVRVVVEREIRLAIHRVLEDAHRPDLEQTVEYETVLRAIKSDSRITAGEFEHNCEQMLRALWGRMAMLLEIRYTKHAPEDT